MASVTTRDHARIQEWARSHGACPAVVSRTGGMLRFEFNPEAANELSPVDWDDFFRVFDEKGLELVYDDKPGSRFHKFAYPETIAAKTPKSRRGQARAAAPRTTARQRSIRENLTPASSGSRSAKAAPKPATRRKPRASAKSKPAASRPRKAA